MMKKYAAMILVIASIGCDNPLDSYGPLEPATIVLVGECHETGSPDQYTIVEFADGVRVKLWYHYGEVGDTFMAQRHKSMRVVK